LFFHHTTPTPTTKSALEATKFTSKTTNTIQEEPGLKLKHQEECYRQEKTPWGHKKKLSVSEQNDKQQKPKHQSNMVV
jgi:hypothetical protein